LANDVQARAVLHLNVEQDKIGSMSKDGIDSLRTAFALSHDLDVIESG
jgi:hypothetical protein